jgi:hypothetical protein
MEFELMNAAAMRHVSNNLQPEVSALISATVAWMRSLNVVKGQ